MYALIPVDKFAPLYFFQWARKLCIFVEVDADISKVDLFPREFGFGFQGLSKRWCI